MDIKDLPLKSIGLSNRSYNALTRAGHKTVGDIMEYDEAALLALPALGANSVKEIIQKRDGIIENGRDVDAGDPFSLQKNDGLSNFDFRFDPEYKESILTFFREKDLSLADSGLHGRPLNQLLINGYKNLSDIIMLTEEDLRSIPQMGQTSISKVLDCISKHVSENEARIRALHDGDDTILWDDELIKQSIILLSNLTKVDLPPFESPYIIPTTGNCCSTL